MEELGNLKGSEAHSTIILTDEDKNVLRKLGINLTFDPYHHQKLVSLRFTWVQPVRHGRP